MKQPKQRLSPDLSSNPIFGGAGKRGNAPPTPRRQPRGREKHPALTGCPFPRWDLRHHVGHEIPQSIHFAGDVT